MDACKTKKKQHKFKTNLISTSGNKKDENEFMEMGYRELVAISGSNTGSRPITELKQG